MVLQCRRLPARTGKGLVRPAASLSGVTLPSRCRYCRTLPGFPLVEQALADFKDLNERVRPAFFAPPPTQRLPFLAASEREPA